ncbi:MBL fold metallo-hydrolase [Thermogemmatispora onikobensis]|uniref:MBL fold metallo-hydrolase n=1 Tax=Thermogemmatispora onikobensis TaxID=732234 RepID=UPI0008538838|nr:MBL fold metallo-hydrolase [Thermogemmatispora onikobensis]
MASFAYTRGLHDLGHDLYAYLQPPGTWGLSNAGLIVDGQATLLVDTLFDLKLTGQMLETMKRAVPAAAEIGTVVNTHANGDHCYGNQLVANAQIIASRQAAIEMQEEPPERLRTLLTQTANLPQLQRFLQRAFGAFDFSDITLTPPTRTFSGELTLHVGSKEVRLIEVGPAHTRGDIIVYVPSERVVFSGDILFIGAHPIMWAGPTANWLRACDLILQLDPEIIVPGHGPITDQHGVSELKGYLQYIYDEARKRYEAGLSALEAARDIPLDRYATWTDGERIVANVAAMYREFSGDQNEPEKPLLFASMAAVAS